MRATRDLITSTYEAFNRRDIDTVLALMQPDVDWPNGMDGGRLYGHQQVREYWKRMWATVDPQVTPMMYDGSKIGTTMLVYVRQFIRDLAGKVIVDQPVQHVFSIRDGLIERMDIRAPDASPIDRFL